MDASYFVPKEGNYYNCGNSCNVEFKNVHLNLNNIITVVEDYATTVRKNDFIVFLGINHVLEEKCESTIRKRIGQLGRKIVIVKDISSWSTPEGVYDVSVITVKLSISDFKTFFSLFEPNQLDFINICDDYNPDIFSERDTYLAMLENYRFKFWFDLKVHHFGLSVKYGYIKNTESYVEELLTTLRL